jgi:hypothetical protein
VQVREGQWVQVEEGCVRARRPRGPRPYAPSVIAMPVPRKRTLEIMFSLKV